MKLRIALAQLNLLVGDIEGNCDKIIKTAITARDTHHADLIVYPELAISGYPPEDLLLRRGFYERIKLALEQIKAAVTGIDLLVGYPEMGTKFSYNKASLIRDGAIVANYHKQHLPNYSVFDEKRYFISGCTPEIVDIKGIPAAITICEDLWYEGPMSQAIAAEAKLVLCINASPFDAHKDETRKKIMGTRAREGNMPLVYVNQVAGQDELVFDGGSMVLDEQGNVTAHANFFQEELLIADFEQKDNQLLALPGKQIQPMTIEARIYQALVFGVRDYIEKNNFPRAIIGLSGGVDSALTLAIAVDAIGADRVEAIMMPSRYTSSMSLEDAQAQAETLNVNYRVISIENVFHAFLTSLADEFKQYAEDSTEENLQARCRGVILMAISNKKNAIVLATGNKSEMSVGYATLYGDMAGGFCVLKDIPKTMVYRLCQYRNQNQPIIPERVLTRAPSAELKADQVDQDSLPPYDILDQILELYIEKDLSPTTIIAAGFDPQTVNRICQLVDRNEYKRRQAAPGVRISEKAFGRDRRYPITSGFGKYFK